MSDIGVKRIELHKVIPLEVPLALQITPSGFCNFKCNFCLQSLTSERLNQLGVRKEMMAMDVFTKIVDGLSAFEGKVKMLVLGGSGEPLLHPDIDLMVKKANGKVEKVEIVTNASLLTNELSDKLIAAGLDRLRISIEGMSAKKYKEICDVNIGFQKLVSNIEYFYQHKKDTDVYIKIIDFELNDEKERELFYHTFEGISDYINVECLSPYSRDIDYTKLKESFNSGVRGNAVEDIEICPQPFYTLAVNTNGDVYPCNFPVPIILGNLNEISLKSIWESEKRNTFLRMLLYDKNENLVCKSCDLYKYVCQPEDYLDAFKNQLIKKFEY